MEIIKEIVKSYWDNQPCGTGDIPYQEGTKEYYWTISKRRDKWDSLIPRYARFTEWKGKNVLEVGCGVGSDLVRFASAGANIYGIDLSSKSAKLASNRLKIFEYKGIVVNADAEDIPFEDNMFSYVYSWGSIHHTPDIEKAINEIYRVVKVGGKICVMLYHKPSLVCFQMWLLYGLLKGKPFNSIDDILAEYHESKGTKAFTVKHASDLFSKFKDVKIETIITSYDLRYSKNLFMPLWISKLIPKQLGWNMIITGIK